MTERDGVVRPPDDADTDLYTTVLPEVAREAAEASAALVPRAVVVTGASETGGLPSVSDVRDRRPADSTGSR